MQPVYSRQRGDSNKDTQESGRAVGKENEAIYILFGINKGINRE